jgi:hypothetical protein
VKITNWIAANDLDGAKISSYVTAFKALVAEGSITPLCEVDRRTIEGVYLI